MKYIKVDNKLITMFDVVRFITASEHNKFDVSVFDGVDDYRVILTHGVMGELLMVIENDYYGLDKSKLIFLCNNIQTTSYLLTLELNAHTISEYIFSNDDWYTIKPSNKIYDCIFPGRESKTLGLFGKDYNSNLLIMNKLPEYPMHHDQVIKYFNQSKCGLMTTESEGSCLSVGEMLLCGLPIISVKIPDNLSKETYYPHHPNNKKMIENTYGLILPNTLGGRELWLNENNSLYCERNDDSIEQTINELNTQNIDSYWIRRDFLSKLSFQRYQFLYLLKNTLETINIDIDKIDLNSFINLPYGNSTINSSQWNDIKSYYLTSLNKLNEK
jgi:hypothetical protein